MQPIELDTECYRNFYLIKFRNHETGNTRQYAMYPGSEPLPVQTIVKVLRSYTIYTFNGINYDMPMIHLAVKLMAQGTSPERACSLLKDASDWIIQGKHRGWQFMDQFGLTDITGIDHVDLIEVAPGKASLKLYGGRLHCRKLQELPIEPDQIIADDEREPMDEYCGNDLITTADLRTYLTPQLKLREHMTESYGLDLRSKSDAQIAEAVIKSELVRMLGTTVSKPRIEPGTTYRYRAPAFIQFLTPELASVLREIELSDFVLSDKHKIIEPPALKNRAVPIGKGSYRMGIGGLHSSETSVTHVATEETLLIDRDVASYYPAIILQCSLYPKHLTAAFLSVYKSIFDRRIAAKRAGDKVTADTYKIVLNGSFGKFGSKFSLLFSPDLMIQVTITGQLALLMLIEWLEERLGIPVVSANTDGIVIKCPADRKAELDTVVALWEKKTGFETEETRYGKLCSRDVNNYMALKDREFYRSIMEPDEFAKTDKKGWGKGKGAFADAGLQKNPTNRICIDAAQAFIEHGTPIAETIYRCRDVRQFVTVRTVRGGAIRVTKTNYDDTLTMSKKRDFLLANDWFVVVPGTVANMRLAHGFGEQWFDIESAYQQHCGPVEWEYVGKVVRFYHAAGETGCLRYKIPNGKGNHNRVPGSDGARSMMELRDEFPADLDYDYYLTVTNAILQNVGHAAKTLNIDIEEMFEEAEQKDDE